MEFLGCLSFFVKTDSGEFEVSGNTKVSDSEKGGINS